jgi:hypothetical protein
MDVVEVSSGNTKGALVHDWASCNLRKRPYTNPKAAVPTGQQLRDGAFQHSWDLVRR